MGKKPRIVKAIHPIFACFVVIGLALCLTPAMVAHAAPNEAAFGAAVSQQVVSNEAASNVTDSVKVDNTVAPLSVASPVGSIGQIISSSLNSSKPAFLFFYADWCGYCQTEKAVINDLEQEYSGAVSFIRVNERDYPEALQEFGVTSLPAMLVITEDSDGDYNTQRFIGYRDAGFLQDSLDRAIIQQVSSWVQRHGEGIDNATSSSQGGKCSTDGQCSSCSPAGTALGLTTLPNQGEEAAIDIEKLTNGQDADVPPGPSILVGSVVVWSYVVTNTGNVALTGIIVTDDMGVAVSCPKTTLQPGESMTCTANGIAAACQYSNLGTATGTPEMGPPVTDSDPSHYFGVHHAAIYLEKWANGDDADLPPGPSILAGSSLVWTYVVTNTGDVMLTNVTITDDWGVAVACPKTVLAPGESMTCTGSGTAIAGQYTKVGTATGNPPVGPVVTATDAANYYGCTDYYYDFDRDGHGVGEPRCLSGPEGYYTALMGGACDDDDSTINPSAVEICGDGLDQDCDGMDRPCLVVGGQVYPINDVQPVELVEPGVVTHETASGTTTNSWLLLWIGLASAFAVGVGILGIMRRRA